MIENITKIKYKQKGLLSNLHNNCGYPYDYE